MNDLFNPTVILVGVVILVFGLKFVKKLLFAAIVLFIVYILYSNGTMDALRNTISSFI